MTRQQLLSEIGRLPLAERVDLLEAITRGVREELQTRAPGRESVVDLRGIANPDGPLPPGESSPAEAARPTLSQRLRGTIKFDGPPPADEEVKDAYADYLLEKYS